MEHKNPHATHVLEPQSQAESSRVEEKLLSSFTKISTAAALWECVGCVCMCVCGVYVYLVWCILLCGVFSRPFGALLNMPVNKFLRSIENTFRDLQLRLNLANFDCDESSNCLDEESNC